MGLLKVSAVFFGLVSQCWTAGLNHVVNGEKYTGNEFCIGDNIEFICTLPDNYHMWFWDIPDYMETTESFGIYSYSSPVNVGPGNIFRIQVSKYLPKHIETSIFVTVSSMLNGTMFDCCRGSLDSICQSSTLLIFGPPSAPNIRVTRSDDFKSFMVTIQPPIYGASCVIKYTLTAIKNGLTLEPMTIGLNGTGNVGDLNLCKNIYSFTALAMTIDDESDYSDTVTGMVDFSAIYALSKASLDNGIAQWDISNILPEECYAKYYLQLIECKIENFAILPELDLNDDDVKKVISDISAAMSQTTSTVAGSSSDYQVDLGDCVTGTVYTSITRLDMQPISGHLVLSSAASTYVCSFTIKSVFVPSISRQITNCTRNDSPFDGDGGGSAITRGVVSFIAVVVLIAIVLSVVLLLVYRWKKQGKKERSEYSQSSGYSSTSSSPRISKSSCSSSFNSSYSGSHSDRSNKSNSESAISYNTADSNESSTISLVSDKKT